MGGFHKTLGTVYRPIRKIVDPLNIMDPFKILPGSSSGFTKGRAFTLDQNYGAPLFKMLGMGGSSYQMPKYDFSKMQGMMQNQDNSKMMAGMIAQKQIGNQLAAEQQAAALAAANDAQEANIQSALQGAEQSFAQTNTRPAVATPFMNFKPTNEPTKLNNKFNPPDVSGLTFGGL